MDCIVACARWCKTANSKLCTDSRIHSSSETTLNWADSDVMIPRGHETFYWENPDSVSCLGLRIHNILL